MATVAPGAEDIEPCANERLDRFLTGTVTVLPILALFVVAWQLWNSLLGWHDLVVFFVCYLLTGFGITVGFHRLLTHRAFKCKTWVRAFWTVMGTAAIEGPVTAWVADHRKHHAFSDQEGDPHSPHVDHGHGLKGALRGLAHAHVGWLFIHNQRANKERYAPDLIADPVISWIDRHTVHIILGGLAFPFALGFVLGGFDVDAGLTGLLWGGLVRMLVIHHITYSINSLCHFFGRRNFETDDHSRNLAWLAPFSFGEAWHNNHHAFPTSARHGFVTWREKLMDPSGIVISAMAKLGLAWDVVEITPERQNKKYPGPGAAQPVTDTV